MANLLEQLLDELKKRNLPSKIHECAIIPSREVPFGEQVRKACETNYCGCYGKYWTCPPGVGDWQMLETKYKSYNFCFLYSTLHMLEDSFDIDGMTQGKHDHSAVDLAVREFFQKKNLSFAQLSTEGCHRCEKCTYPDAPCRFPDKITHSVEAVGIDVVSLSRHCEMHYINGMNTVTYFSAVFFTL